MPEESPLNRLWDATFRELDAPELLSEWEEAKHRDRTDPEGMHRLRFIDRYRSGEWARAYHARQAAHEGAGGGRSQPCDVPAEGRLIKAERVLAGLTLRDLAQRTGLSRSALSRIERGTAMLTYAAAVSIVDALGIGLDALRPAPPA